jgi:hypothetical protein
MSSSRFVYLIPKSLTTRETVILRVEWSRDQVCECMERSRE